MLAESRGSASPGGGLRLPDAGRYIFIRSKFSHLRLGGRAAHPVPVRFSLRVSLRLASGRPVCFSRGTILGLFDQLPLCNPEGHGQAPPFRGFSGHHRELQQRPLCPAQPPRRGARSAARRAHMFLPLLRKKPVMHVPGSNLCACYRGGLPHRRKALEQAG